jgi:mannose-6-phosphate isomerase-like protein (cupin superfamily)
MKVVHAVPVDTVSEQVHVKRLTDDLGAAKLRANVWSLAEGAQMRRHRHREQEELYLVLAGSAEIEVEGALHKLGERDALAVPAGEAHRVSNVGPGPLTFVAISAPPSTGDAESA